MKRDVKIARKYSQILKIFTLLVGKVLSRASEIGRWDFFLIGLSGS